MRQEHIAEIVNIERAVFADPWVGTAFERELTNSFSRCFTALDQEGRVVGYLVYWAVKPEFHILNIAVRPDMKRRGIGRLFMNRVLSDALKDEADFLALEVRPSNTAARSLYARYGFVTIGYKKGYYTDGEQAEVMIKHIRK